MKTKMIDTRHGTFNHPEFSNGNTLPYTGVPFGMNYFSIQNKCNTPWFFDPTLPIFQGVRLTHQPSPWMGDYCPILISPYTGEMKKRSIPAYQTSYDIKKSIFQPNYHSLYLLRYQLYLEVAPTMRGAKINLRNDSRKDLSLMLTFKNKAKVRMDNEKKQLHLVVPHITENHHQVNLYMVFDFSNDEHKDFSVFAYKNGKKISGEDILESQQLFIKFNGYCPNLEISLATSFIDNKQAMCNLSKEVSCKSFSEVVAETTADWDHLLDKIEIETTDKEKEKIFYQCMYRSFLFPQTFYEIDETNHPVYFDIYNQKIKSGKFFTNQGFWDTSKTLLPLFSIIIPEVYQGIMEGIVNHYKNISHLPRWLSPDERGLMPGTHANAVIADAAVKGLLTKQQKQLLLEAMVKEAEQESNSPYFGRRGVNATAKYGYVTAEEEGGVNQTVDNAYSDFCIRQVAINLGDMDLAKKFEEHAFNYRNLFDDTTGFLRGKDKNGKFVEPFAADDWSFEYVEASPWINSLGVFHNIDDFNQLFNGKQNFKDHLINLANADPTYSLSKDNEEYNEISEMALSGFGQIAIGNQPGFHVPYLYSYVGAPEYTQLLVKEICDHLFSSEIDGYPGDEDNGSFSAWYIFSTMGFYPVTSGVSEYALGIPQFDKLIISLPNNKKFKIITKNNKPQNNFVKSMELNGKKINRLFIRHQEVTAGGELIVKRSVLPSVKDYEISELPYSLNHDLIKE